MPSPNRTTNRRLRFWFWIVLLFLWTVLICGFVPGAVATSRDPGVSATEAWAVAGIGVASSIIWLGGIRHLLMWMVSLLPVATRPAPSLPGASRTALVYCTANDFSGDALLASMNQSRPVSAVILDDSSDEGFRARVDEFALLHDARVIRRSNRTGYKAGNLNHGLGLLLDEFDFFVILDSDEIIQRDFVERALEDFAADSTIGIVQGRHRATPSGTRFSTRFAGMLESHVAVVQGARSRVGLSVFMGRGAMFSAECIRVAGPFPEVVTEDVAMSIEARLAGFEIRFDPRIVSTEDFPVDYHAFRTQHAKTVEGTTELLGATAGRIVRSGMRFTEKVDVLLEQVLAPAMGASGLVVLVSGVVIAALGGEARQPLWSLFVTALLGLAALLPETIRVMRKRGPIAAVVFLGGASLLYSSTFLVTLNAALKVVLGKRAVFAVTPKKARGGSWLAAAATLRIEIAIAVLVVIAVLLLTGSIAPAFPILAPVAGALAFAIVGTIGDRRRG